MRASTDRQGRTIVWSTTLKNIKLGLDDRGWPLKIYDAAYDIPIAYIDEGHPRATAITRMFLSAPKVLAALDDLRAAVIRLNDGDANQGSVMSDAMNQALAAIRESTGI